MDGHLITSMFDLCLCIGNAAERPRCDTRDVPLSPDGLCEGERDWVQTGSTGINYGGTDFKCFYFFFTYKKTC